MAWSWSHTQEGYDDARTNLENQKLKWLKECWAEIQATTFDENFTAHFDSEVYGVKFMEAKHFPGDFIIQDIWDFAETQRTCDNGGFNAWMCPYGCHTVPFDTEEE
jgi:hypothetical protein